MEKRITGEGSFWREEVEPERAFAKKSVVNVYCWRVSEERPPQVRANSERCEFCQSYVLANGVPKRIIPGDWIVEYEDGSIEVFSDDVFNVKFDREKDL